MDIITSADNESIKKAKSLLDKKYRRFYGEFLLEGPKQIGDAIENGYKIVKFFVDSSKADDFMQLASKTDAPILFVKPNLFKSLCDTNTPQGIVAEVELPAVPEYKYRTGDRLLILDRVSDPGNLGTIIRSATATGFRHIFVIDCADAFAPKVVRASSGTVLNVNIYPTDVIEIINLCKRNYIDILVCDMHGENIFDFDISKDYALVIGNEGHGVCNEIKDVGKLVCLPMRKSVESLNAGVSASVMMYLLEGKNI